MIHAETLAGRQPTWLPWSKALHLASKAVRFWKPYISDARKKTGVSQALSAICASLEWDELPNISLTEPKSELLQAQKDLKACQTHAAKNRPTAIIF
jgi:hypothetical protein